MHAILIWFDYLPYAVPGCCGNTEARTSGFDHFAAGSVTFDNCFINDLRGENGDVLAGTLLRLQSGGLPVSVLSAHPTRLVDLLHQQAKTRACRPIPVEMLNDDDQLMQRLDRAAYESMRATSALDGDEQPSVTIVSLPGVVTAEGIVVDEVLESADRLLDRLALINTADRTLLLVTAGRAHVSAEPGRELTERMLHVPLLGRSGPPLEFGLHSRSLVGQSDVLHALLLWAGLPIEKAEQEGAAHGEALLRELAGERVASRSSLFLRGPDERVGVRTDAWYLATRLDAAEGPRAAARAIDQAVLFVKPDDLWDRLDVASQSPGVVEELVGMLPVGAGKVDEGL
jgi:hypothetical protein